MKRSNAGLTRTVCLLELLVYAHELLHRVNVHARVFRVHALHSCFLAHDDAVTLCDADDINEVAEHVVQHYLLLALVCQEVVTDLLLRHVDFQLLQQSYLDVRRELIDVHAVRVVCNIRHDLIEYNVIASCVRAQTTTTHVPIVLNK